MKSTLQKISAGLILMIGVGCLSLMHAQNCGPANASAAQLSCPVSQWNMPVHASFVSQNATLPNTGVTLVIVVAAWLYTHARNAQKHEPARIRARRRFLHAQLPRYGPQNQFGFRSFVSAVRDP